MKKIEAVPVGLVCSLCGLDWERHGYKAADKPSAEKCIELLKADLAKRPSYVVSGTTTSSYPHLNFGTGI